MPSRDLLLQTPLTSPTLKSAARRKGIAMPAVPGRRRGGEPYRGVANLRKFFHESMAAVCSGAIVSRRSSPRKNLVLPQEKSRSQIRLRFAARDSHRVNVRRGGKSAVARKCFTQRRIFEAAGMVDPAGRIAHRPQVLQAATNFASHRAARPVRRLKCFNRRDVSSCWRVRPPTAFSLPRRA
jgi:hypothetical protein